MEFVDTERNELFLRAETYSFSHIRVLELVFQGGPTQSSEITGIEEYRKKG
jgi:hypothetical protein